MSLNLQTLSGHILTATSQFSCYLPTAQKMIDSFKIDYDGAAATPIPPASSPSITTAHPSSDELSTDHSSSSSSSSGQLPGIIFFLIIVALVQ